MRQKFLAHARCYLHTFSPMTGDHMLIVLAALANSHRLRIIAALQANGRNYVSQLARDVGLSRPLLHLHLQRLQEAGLVRSQLELSTSSKALNYYEVTEFLYELSPSAIVNVAKTLTLTNRNPGDSE